MKSHSWRTIPRWEWEKSKKIAVFALDNKINASKSNILEYIVELLKEIGIPISVVDGNLEFRDDLFLIKEIFSDSLKRNEIDYEYFEEKLREVRGNGKLHYALVILIDREKYEFMFYNKPHEQQAIYGIGVEDGLVLLRHFHKEAVRHEIAHMLGLNHHHPHKDGCIMNWECATSTFCNDCKNQIRMIWREEIEEGKR